MLFLKTSVAVLMFVATAFGQTGVNIVVDCSRGASLQQAVSNATPNQVLIVKGACTGPVTIIVDGLTLIASGPASVNGQGHDVVTVNGAQRVALNGLTITGGNNGVVITNTGQATLQNDTVTANAVTGILAEANSSATVFGGTTTGNGLDGIDLEATSSLLVIGAYSSSGNGVFGVDVNNGSSLTLVQANLSVSSNTLGVQLGTNAAGFMDNFSTLNASNNVTVGLTMVSGSHMVDFGGVIVSNGNGNNGISLNSKAGLDCDAAAQVTSNNNAGDGVHLEQTSVMTIFNNPNFSGVPGTTTLTTHGNLGSGVNLLTASEILVDNFAEIVSTGNVQAGLSQDDGSSVSFGQTIPVSGVQTIITGNNPDLLLTFAARLTVLINDTFGTVHCDGTVLTRGPGAPTCPQGSLKKK